MPWQNFQSSEGSTLIFGYTRISFKHSAGRVERSFRIKASSIRSAVSIEHRLVTDRQTDRHRAIASSGASIASRVKTV